MKKILITFLVLALAFGSLLADERKVGSTGAQFLKIGVGSKYQGIGESSVAVVNDVYAMFWNPAGLAQIENSSIGFTNVNYLLDVNLNYIGYAKSFEDIGVFGAAVTILTMNDMEITNYDNPDGTGEFYDAGSYAFTMSYARQLNARFAFGASVKYLGEKIHNEKAQGIAVDFGTMLYTGYRSLRLGMSISNMGGDMKFTGSDLMVLYDEQDGDGNNDPIGADLKSTSYELPLVFRVGLAYDMEFGPNSVLTLSSELKHPNDNIQQGAFGAQFAFMNQFYLRGGYKINYEEEGLAFGGGLDMKIAGNTNINIDYAWQDFGRLSSAQRFSLGFSF